MKSGSLYKQPNTKPSHSKTSILNQIANNILKQGQKPTKKTFIDSDFTVKDSIICIHMLPQTKRVKVKPKETTSSQSQVDIIKRCATEGRRNSFTESSINDQHRQSYCEKLNVSRYTMTPTYCMQWIESKYKREEFNRLQQSYEQIKAIHPQLTILNQINKDISRTQKADYYGDQIKSVLVAYSNYDPNIGYVQGMNCIAAVLMNHSKQEWIAFWLLVQLIEQLEIREVLQLKQNCINKYSRVLEFLIHKTLPQIHKHFQKLQINIHLFLQQWLLSLLMQLIPFQYTQQFTTGLLQGGITYLYMIMLTVLKHMQQELLKFDQIETLILLTSKHNDQLKWTQIFANPIDVPKLFVNTILDCFDMENDRFLNPIPQKQKSPLIEQFFSFNC